MSDSERTTSFLDLLVDRGDEPEVTVGSPVRRVMTCATERPAELTGRRALRLIISDQTLDRYKEVILAKGWVLDNYAKNPVILWMHSPEQPVGNAIKTFVDPKKKALVQDVEFMPPEVSTWADTVYKMYAPREGGKPGFLRAASVGFLPLEFKFKRRLNGKEEFDAWDKLIKDEGLEGEAYGDVRGVHLRQELLENSMVSIPANPNALVQNALRAELDGTLRGAVEAGVLVSGEAEAFARRALDLSPWFNSVKREEEVVIENDPTRAPGTTVIESDGTRLASLEEKVSKILVLLEGEREVAAVPVVEGETPQPEPVTPSGDIYAELLEEARRVQAKI